MKLAGVIKSDGFVETSDGKLFILPIRGTDESGFPEVLIDATCVGGSGYPLRLSNAELKHNWLIEQGLGSLDS